MTVDSPQWNRLLAAAKTNNNNLALAFSEKTVYLHRSSHYLKQWRCEKVFPPDTRRREDRKCEVNEGDENLGSLMLQFRFGDDGEPCFTIITTSSHKSLKSNSVSLTPVSDRSERPLSDIPLECRGSNLKRVSTVFQSCHWGIQNPV
jgi:hypothetical protein